MLRAPPPLHSQADERTHGPVLIFVWVCFLMVLDKSRHPKVAEASLIGVDHALLNNRISLNLALGGSCDKPAGE